MRSATGPIRALVSQVVERVQRGVRDGPDRTAVPAVPAGRAALGNVLLPPEGDAAVAAVAPLDVDFRGVDEHDVSGER
jgi:hypothetical protein